MKKAMFRTALVLGLLALYTLGAGAQGMYWESEMTSDKNPGAGISKTWYMPKMLKIETGWRSQGCVWTVWPINPCI